MRPEDESQGPVVRDRRRIDPVTGQVRDPGQPGPQRGPGPAGGQPRPGRHSVSRPGGQGGGAEGAPGWAPQGGARQGGGAREVPGSYRVIPDDGGPSGPGGAGPGGAGPGGPADRGAGPDSGDAVREQAEAAAAESAAKLAERTADLQRLQAEFANYRKRVERDRMAVREQALANVLNELIPVLDDIGRAREHGELTGGFKSVGESLEAIASKLGLAAFGEAGDPFDPMLHDALTHAYSADVTEPTAVQIFQPGYKVGERIIRPARVAVAEPSGDSAPDGAAPLHGEALPDEPIPAANQADPRPGDDADRDQPGAAPGEPAD